jgi:lipid A ethanolaminephosphotransferase
MNPPKTAVDPPLATRHESGNGARGLRLPRGRVSINRLLLLVSLFLSLTQNRLFWRHVMQALPPGHGPADVGLLACLFVTLNVLLLLIMVPLSARIIVKPALILMLLTASICSYFMDTFGTIIDQSMIVNALQTDPREAGELLNRSLLLHVLVSGIVPAVLVARLEIISGGALRELLRRGLLTILALATLAVCVAADYKDVSLWVRANREVRVYANPSYPIYASIGQLKSLYKSDRHVPIMPIATDATRSVPASGRPRVLVLVVGETARAANFQLDGYQRATNPELAAIPGVTSFTEFRSCGTATAVSVPCMFSRLGRDHFSAGKAAAQENLLDVLQRTGVKVLWRDNNSSSKGVADRVPYQDLRHLKTAHLCGAESCFDDVLLDGLEPLLTDGHDDRVIVLHLLGSHGPSYYKRYPPSFRRFTPECAQDDVQHCSREEIVNAYDNTLLYTDHVLASLIGMLQQHAAQIDPSLIYLSDHGESLGENGIYLHGLPYAIAPDEQTHVPFVVWSPTLDSACLRARRDHPYSQDNLFDTVLGIFTVQTRVYRREADMFSACAATHAGAR